MKNMLSERQHEEWNSKMIMSLMTNTSRVFLFLAIVLLVVDIYGTLELVNKAAADNEERVFSKGNMHHAATQSRRLLLTLTTTDNDDGDGNIGNGGNDDGNGRDDSMNRIGVGADCTKDNILIFQGATSPLPNGIPTYTVEIQNVCMLESCNISNIHVSCGWFSSARLINPRVFRRVGYDDCLVNDGEPLNPGEALSFQYANTFEYPISVSSVAC